MYIGTNVSPYVVIIMQGLHNNIKIHPFDLTKLFIQSEKEKIIVYMYFSYGYSQPSTELMIPPALTNCNNSLCRHSVYVYGFLNETLATSKTCLM